MKVVSLDPSLTATGVATSDDPTTATVISPPKGMRGPERLRWIQLAVDKLCRDADLVVVEGYSHGSGYQAHALGELGGVIRLTLHCRGVPYVDYPPTCRMKLATGTGRASKMEVLAEAIKRLGYTGHNENEADALWMLQAALIHYGLPGAVDLPAKHLGTAGKSKARWPDL